MRLVGALVEEVVAADERREDAALVLEERLERAPGADRAVPPLRRMVRVLLRPHPGEELVQVVSDPQHVSYLCLPVRTRSDTAFSASTVNAIRAPGTMPYQGAAYM